jgi:hypothetical protein
VAGVIMTGPSHQEIEASRRLVAQAHPLMSEAHALCYALVMALASKPREEFSRAEIDALCQVAYEVLHKLDRALECFAELDVNSAP